MKPTLLAALICVVAVTVVLVPSIGAAEGSVGDVGRGETELTGNNLSYPAVWAEGTTLSLRGTMGSSALAGAYATLAGAKWYEQQDALNTWQAENAAGTAGTQVDIEYVDWADALESMDWALGSKVRVEIVLYHTATMYGYPMTWLRGSGTTEMWGTKEGDCATTDPTTGACLSHYGVKTTGNYAAIYSKSGRLTIQKIGKDPSAASPTDLTWDATQHVWKSLGVSAGPVVFNHGVWEAFATGTKPWEKFGSEINLPGKAIYGSLWDTTKVSDGIGLYRLTFSLDATHSPNAIFLASTGVAAPSDDLLKDPLAVPGETGEVANTPVVRSDLNLTYIDVGLVGSRGGSGR